MKLQIAVLFSAIILTSSFSFSVVTLKGVGGVSYFDSAANKIYAGYAGTCAAPDSSKTCNTCTDTTSGGLKPCNQKAIHGALKVSFSFTSSADLSTKEIALYIGDDTSSSKISTTSKLGSAAGVEMSLSVPWSVFCDGIAGLTSDCSVSSVDDQIVSTGQHFYIGADEDTVSGIQNSTERLQIPVHFHSISDTNTGLHTQAYCPVGTDVGYGMCFYSLATGDGKLGILEDPEPRSGPTPPGDSPAFQAVAFFAFEQPSAGVSTSVSNGSVQPVIKQFTSTTNLSISRSDDAYITGLDNYKRYCVFAGQVNLAQNIFAFTTTSLDDTQMCQVTSEVAGMLEDNHCFISTAAFGSDMASEVQTFRNFRNAFLLNNRLGAEFVKSYYQWGPFAAEFISNSEFLKSVTRAGLYPALGFSWLALNYGIWPAVLVLLLSLIFSFQLVQKLRQILSPRTAHDFSKTEF